MCCFLLLDQLALKGEVFCFRHLESQGGGGGGKEFEAGAALSYQDRTILDLFWLVYCVAHNEHPFGGDGFEGESTVGAVEEVKGGGDAINRPFERHHTLGVVGESHERLVELFLGGFHSYDKVFGLDGGLGVGGFDIAKTTSKK